jgi:O-antigen/teichoic acid export membrane protein
MTTPVPVTEGGGNRLVKSALALLISNATGAVLGVVFWAAAARLFPAKDVGYGVAEIAAMTFLANVAQLNLGAIFPRFLYAAGERAREMLTTGYLASIAVAMVAGTAFLTLTSHHAYIPRGVLPAAFFLAAVVLWTVFTIEDAALTGLRATFWVPVENTSFSLVKVLLLPVFAAFTPITGVFDSWTLPVIACVVPVNYYLFRKVLPAHVARFRSQSSLPSGRVIRSVVVGEYLGGLSLTALYNVPVLLIVARLGATETAYFQTPWLAGTSFDLLLWSIATSLVVESSARPDHVAVLVRSAVRLTVRLLLPGLVILVVGAPFLLRVLGGAYAEHGTRLLQCLALTLPFMGVNVLYVTFARVARRVRRIMAVQVGVAVLILGLMELLIKPFGLTGAGLAFLVGQAIVAAIVTPSIVRQYRRADMAPNFAITTVTGIREQAQK